jgi:hypothetical protein
MTVQAKLTALKTRTALFGSAVVVIAALGGGGGAAQPPPERATPRPSTATSVPKCDMFQLQDSVQVYTSSEHKSRKLFEFTAKNTSQTTCNVDGYFGISVYGRPGGTELTALDSRRANAPDGNPVPHLPINISPGGTVVSEVTLRSNIPGTCPLIRGFHLIPPNDTRYRRVLLPASTDAKFCQALGSSVDVYPTEP